MGAYIGLMNINQPSLDYDKTTPLYWAIREGHLDVTHFLLENGSTGQPLNVYGDTAIYVAVQYNRCDILSLLLEMGHDPNLESKSFP